MLFVYSGPLPTCIKRHIPHDKYASSLVQYIMIEAYAHGNFLWYLVEKKKNENDSKKKKTIVQNFNPE